MNVTFSSSSDRQYQIEYRADLADSNEAWQVDAAWFAGAGTQTVQMAVNDSTNRFYRIRVKLR